MKQPTIHLTESFSNNEEFLLFALTHPTLTLQRMQMEFAECVVDKYQGYLDELLETYPQLNLICDDPRVAVAFAARWKTKDVKPQRLKFKADFVI